jgi:hypothetical protein
MQLITPRRPQPYGGSLITGTMLGACFVAVGLGLALLAFKTSLVAGMVPGSRTATTQAGLVFLAWALVFIACAGLLFAGTNRLAAVAATVRIRRRRRSPVVAALGSLPADVTVATDVIPVDGRPIPELVIGPFGIAVIHELGRRDAIRQVGTSWERRTRAGWAPAEHPLDAAERDAERVRHWLTTGDLDFVVRVHAALITADPSMLRSPLCAVITEAQIPDWIASLPRQRTLSEGRRQQIVARVRGAVATDGQRRAR